MGLGERTLLWASGLSEPLKIKHSQEKKGVDTINPLFLGALKTYKIIF